MEKQAKKCTVTLCCIPQILIGCCLSGGFSFSASPFHEDTDGKKHGRLNINSGTVRKASGPPYLQTSFLSPKSRIILKKLCAHTGTNQTLFPWTRIPFKAEGHKPTCFMRWGNCSFPLLPILSLYPSVHNLKHERKKRGPCRGTETWRQVKQRSSIWM